MSAVTNTVSVPHRTSDQLVSVDAFHAIIWTGVSLCSVAFMCRAYIRIVCHGRFLADDYLVFLALLTVIGTGVNGQLSLICAYIYTAVANGHEAPGPNFLHELKVGLRGLAANFILCFTGLTFIKLGFIVFFYRLGNMVTKFRVLWSVILVLTIGCMSTVLGVTPWNCVLSDINTILTVCHFTSVLDHQEKMNLLAIALDVFSDVLIICFPVTILWGTRITWRKKAILTATFSLILATVAITIVRGPIFESSYSSTDADKKVMNVTWLWFWTNMELIVSFLVSCLVSFRALFVQKENSDSGARARAVSDEPTSSSMREKAKRFHRNFIDTLKTLDDDDGYELAILPTPASGRISLDFERRENWSTATRSFRDHADSPKTPQQVHCTV